LDGRVERPGCFCLGAIKEALPILVVATANNAALEDAPKALNLIDVH
jgi:hypothetical protein